MARKRDGRTYITLHDGMPDHPKVDGLSDAAFRLLVSSWCWCSRHLTDGVIPATTWGKRGTPKARRELLTAGLAEQDADGTVRMHDYLQHQRSAAEVAELSEKRSEAGRKGGKARATSQANGKQVLDKLPSKTEAESVTETDTATDVAVPPTPPAPATGPGRDDVERLCDHLADRVEANGSKRPVVSQRWRDAARLLLDRDGRTEDQVHAAIDWCQGDEFWRSNVLSMPTLREQYDRLRLAAQRPAASPARHQPFRNPTDPDAYGGTL